MIDEGTLESLSGRFRDKRQLEKDYLLTLLLYEISLKLTDELVFKGGTALKFFYGLNRFSEDIDFTYSKIADATGRNRLDAKIETALKSFGIQYSVENREKRYAKDGDIIRGLNYSIRVKGPLNGKSGELQNIKIDISFRDDLLLKPKLMYYSPIYPDITTFPAYVMDQKEILAEKVASIIERSKMRDIYDLYYFMKFRNVPYEKSLIAEKMDRRGETFDIEKLSKKIDLATDKMKWRSELAYLIAELPDGEEVANYLKNALDLNIL